MFVFPDQTILLFFYACLCAWSHINDVASAASSICNIIVFGCCLNFKQFVDNKTFLAFKVKVMQLLFDEAITMLLPVWPQ